MKKKKKKKNKLDLVFAHIPLSAAKTVYPLAKTQVALYGVSAAHKQFSEDCVLHKAGSDTSNDDNIPLEKLASSSWSYSDSDVSLSVFAKLNSS